MLKHMCAIVVVVCAVAGTVQAGEKVLLCHMTSSETNPYVLISVSKNALDAQLNQGSTIAVELPDGTYSCEITPDPTPI